MLIGLIPVLASCGGGGSKGGNCGNTAPCGGDIIGTWNVTQSCIDVASTSSFTGSCTQATTHGSNLAVHGTVSYSADGTYSINITLSGNIVITVPVSCLTQNGATLTCSQLTQAMAQTVSGVSCSDAGGGSCSCTSPVPSAPTTETGTYTTQGSVVTLTHGGTTDHADYCVRGNELIETPQAGSSSGITGTVIGTKQ